MSIQPSDIFMVRRSGANYIASGSDLVQFLQLNQCEAPPYFCRTDVSTACISDFTGAWKYCPSIFTFPSTVDTSSGTNFTEAWRNCQNLAGFPSLDFSSGTNFRSAWQDCSSLVTFPASLFDGCAATNFTDAWKGCALNQTSVDNILVSLDTAGQSNGFLGIYDGTSATPGVAGAAAKSSLEGKGWIVTVN